MPAVLRLARAGAKKNPIYHLVAADKRRARDGRHIEKLGLFNPGRDPEVLDLNLERVIAARELELRGADPAEQIVARRDLRDPLELAGAGPQGGDLAVRQQIAPDLHRDGIERLWPAGGEQRREGERRRASHRDILPRGALRVPDGRCAGTTDSHRE